MSEKCKVKCDCHDDDDTKPVEGLGEALAKLRAYRDQNPPLSDEIFNVLNDAINNYDALKQRVKVLEEAHESPHSRAHREKALEFANKERVRYRVALLQIVGMENLMFDDADAEEIIRIAKEAIDLQCGDCGDDGEEPSNDCPTCKGTGFKCLK